MGTEFIYYGFGIMTGCIICVASYNVGKLMAQRLRIVNQGGTKK